LVAFLETMHPFNEPPARNAATPNGEPTPDNNGDPLTGGHDGTPAIGKVKPVQPAAKDNHARTAALEKRKNENKTVSMVTVPVLSPSR
jgi:hypothetical protein